MWIADRRSAKPELRATITQLSLVDDDDDETADEVNCTLDASKADLAVRLTITTVHSTVYFVSKKNEFKI